MDYVRFDLGLLEDLSMSDVTRRSFLEHTLVAAAAGLAAANIAKGADVPKSESVPTTQPGGKVARTDRIGMAVIGLHGRGTDAHVEAWSTHDNVEVIAICDVDEAQFAKPQDKLAEHGRPVAKTYQDLRKL